MKKLFIAFLCLGSVSVFAQNGFFLQPEIGAGISNSKVEHPRDIINFPWGLSWQVPLKNIFTYNPQLIIGYQFSHLSITSGISFLKTGFIEDSAVGGGGGISYFPYKETAYYYHVVVPLIITYKFNISHRFFLSPGIGGSFFYTYSSVSNVNSNNSYWGAPYSDHTLSNTEFSNNYKRTGLGGIALINFEYKISNRVNILAGPEYQAMLNSMLTDKYNSQKNYAYTFNAGIMWYFSKVKGKNTGKE